MVRGKGIRLDQVLQERRMFVLESEKEGRGVVLIESVREAGWVEGRAREIFF